MKEVYYYYYSRFSVSVVVRVGKVAENTDVYLFCSQLTTKRRKYICTVTIPFMKDSSREMSISFFLVNHGDFLVYKVIFLVEFFKRFSFFICIPVF